MLLISYPFSATSCGSVNPDKLVEEIRDSGSVTEFAGVCADQTVQTIDIHGEAIASQSGLDAVVAAHSACTLDEYKAAKNATIDARTDAIIAGGFDFDGNNFSLSTEAQTNWIALAVFSNTFQWPVAVTTNDDREYLLSAANFPAFLYTGKTKVGDSIASGRALKLQVNAAITKAEVDAIVDPR
jgi:hypothetical protein